MKNHMPRPRALLALAFAATLVSTVAIAQQATSSTTSTDAPRQRLDANEIDLYRLAALQAGAGTQQQGRAGHQDKDYTLDQLAHVVSPGTGPGASVRWLRNSIVAPPLSGWSLPTW